MLSSVGLKSSTSNIIPNRVRDYAKALEGGANTTVSVIILVGLLAFGIFGLANWVALPFGGHIVVHEIQRFFLKLEGGLSEQMQELIGVQLLLAMIAVFASVIGELSTKRDSFSTQSVIKTVSSALILLASFSISSMYLGVFSDTTTYTFFGALSAIFKLDIATLLKFFGLFAAISGVLIYSALRLIDNILENRQANGKLGPESLNGPQEKQRLSKYYRNGFLIPFVVGVVAVTLCFPISTMVIFFYDAVFTQMSEILGALGATFVSLGTLSPDLLAVVYPMVMCFFNISAGMAWGLCSTKILLFFMGSVIGGFQTDHTIWAVIAKSAKKTIRNTQYIFIGTFKTVLFGIFTAFLISLSNITISGIRYAYTRVFAKTKGALSYKKEDFFQIAAKGTTIVFSGFFYYTCALKDVIAYLALGMVSDHIGTAEERRLFLERQAAKLEGYMKYIWVVFLVAVLFYTLWCVLYSYGFIGRDAFTGYGLFGSLVLKLMHQTSSVKVFLLVLAQTLLVIVPSVIVSINGREELKEYKKAPSGKPNVVKNV